MVEANLQVLESLLVREEEILQQLPALHSGTELDRLLDELSGSLQRFQCLLVQLREADPGSADKSSLGRLQRLKQKRERNVASLQEILQSDGEKMAALQAEKKTLNLYRPARPKEPRLLDDER